jgi:hypothetical protein
MKEDQTHKEMVFTRRGAWLGLIAYIVVVILVAVVFV